MHLRYIHIVSILFSVYTKSYLGVVLAYSDFQKNLVEICDFRWSHGLDWYSGVVDKYINLYVVQQIENYVCEIC